MFQTTKGLILREVRYKESSRILTILTETEGKITAQARGALRKTSRSFCERSVSLSNVFDCKGI